MPARRRHPRPRARGRTTCAASTSTFRSANWSSSPGVSGLRKVLAGFRHGLRRGPAPLRRDLLALRPAVPRPHGQAAGGPDRGHPAGHRDRPDQPGAHLALDRRHDDRAERSPEAAVRAGRRSCIAGAAASRCTATRRRRSFADARGARRGAGRSAAGGHVSGRRAEEFQRDAKCSALLEQQGYTRVHARERPGSSRWCWTGSALASADRSRVLEALEAGVAGRRGRVACELRGWHGDTSPARKRTALRLSRLQVAHDGRGSPSARRTSPMRASRRTCTAPSATSTTASRRRASSRSTPRSAPARPAAASAASSASTTASWYPTPARRCAAARCAPGRPSRTRSARTTSCKFARKRGIPLDTPWRDLTEEQRRWVIDGEGAVGEEGLVRREAVLRVARDARATRCTSACCSRSTAATPPARTAAARGSRPRRCCGGSVRRRGADARASTSTT